MKPKSTFKEAKKKIHYEGIAMNNMIDLCMAKMQVDTLQPLVTFESFLNECRLPVTEAAAEIKQLRVRLGGTISVEVFNEKCDDELVKHSSIIYKTLISQLAVKESKAVKLKQAQLDLDRKQQEAAGKMSPDEVLESFVDSRIEAKKGKGKSSVDFRGLLPGGVACTSGSAFVSDISEEEWHRRSHSKKELSELKHQKAALSKNSSSPGVGQGQNTSQLKAQAKPKPKPKAKAKPKPTSGPDIGKGKEGKSKNKGKGKGKELQASAPNTKKGRGKGKPGT